MSFLAFASVSEMNFLATLSQFGLFVRGKPKLIAKCRDKHKYVSPSDMIMSPATKKLEALKGKRFGKAKGQSLFANTTTKNHNGNMDADLGKAMDQKDALGEEKQ